MNFPLLSEFVESIRSAEDNLAELNHLRPVLDEDGMSSGNFAVVFKMKDEQTGKLYALKCFTKEQEGRAEAYRMIADELESVKSTYLTPFKYLDKELFVDSNVTDDTEFPVLLMDWVEGQTLDKYIRENIDDQYALEMLAYQFSRLAMWLLPQPFAHGDLKPDNIIVREDGSLVLVDYDGMYVPAMKGQKARELGSPDFRHPSRTADEFNEHIDDFPIASILLSLKAIALQPELLEKYGAKDRLLLSSSDYFSLSQSEAITGMHALMADYGFAKAYSFFILAYSQYKLTKNDFQLVELDLFPDVACDYALKLSQKGCMEEAFDIWFQLAQRGIAIARVAFNVGYCYYRGLGVEQNKQEAIKWLTIAKKHNNPQAYTLLGQISHKTDKKEAFSLFLKASDLGDKMGMFFLGVYYEKGIVKNKDDAKAFEFYNASAEQGYSRAQRKLGEVYKDGILGQDKSLLKSFQWYNKAAEQGDSSAQFYIGYYYDKGQGVEKDAFKAVEWYLRASAQNNLAALNNLGVCYEFGNGVDIDLSKAFSYYEKSATQGNVVAQRNLSNCYLNGIGIAQNLEEAFGWRQKAANNKDVSSQKKVAEWYFKGFGVEKDNEQALVWFTKSKLQGDKNDIVVDSEVAIESLIRLANDGDVPIQYIVGKCYEYGVGVKKDINEARKWFERAMGNGYVEAFIKLKRINECSTSATIQSDKDIWDKNDVIYSADYKKVIGRSDWIDSHRVFEGTYYIKTGTRLIADYSLQYRSYLNDINKIIIPKSIVLIGKNPFIGYPTGLTIECKSCAYYVKDGALYSKDGKRLISYFGSDFFFKIPEGVEVICDSAFKNNNNLQKIFFPSSLKTIEKEAFKRCTNIRRIELPHSITSIEESAFEGCKSMDSVLLGGCSITVLYERTFKDCCISEFFLPDSLIELKEHVFEGNRLKKVIFPDTVKTIGDEAFRDNPTLESVIFPKFISRIGYSAFYGCNIKSIKLPEGLIEIGGLSFSHCPLDQVIIPNTVSEIGWNPFGDAQTIICDGNARYCVKNNMLIDNEKKELIAYFGGEQTIIPKGILSIGYQAFSDSAIVEVFIGNDVERINDGAFWGCKFLETINVGKNVNIIGESAFRFCKSLKTVHMEESNVGIIYDSTFENCERLEYIGLSSIKEIHKYAFAWCVKLKQIDIPSTISYIGNCAFNRCEGLTDIYIRSRKIQLNYSIFDSVDGYGFDTIDYLVSESDIKKAKKIFIHVPKGCSGNLGFSTRFMTWVRHIIVIEDI